MQFSPKGQVGDQEIWFQSYGLCVFKSRVRQIRKPGLMRHENLTLEQWKSKV